MGDHVFISYSRKDQDFVKALAEGLKDLGVSIWLDQRDIHPGSNWNREIYKALSECSSFLVVLSPNSVKSYEVEAEWNDALNKNKKVIPIIYKKCDMPPRLSLLQFVDFTSRSPNNIYALKEVWREINEQIPDPGTIASACFKQGLTLRAQGKHDEAIQAFDEAIKYNPQLKEAWYNKGNALVNLGKDNDAVGAYDKAIEINPEYAEAWFRKGVAFINSSASGFSEDQYLINTLNSLEAIEKPDHEALNGLDLEINGNSQDDMLWYCKDDPLLLIPGRYDDAIIAFDKVADLSSGNDAAWNNKGNILYIQGKYNEAVVAFDKAIEINPLKCPIWNNKGNALCSQGRYNEAIQAFDKAIEIDPRFWIAWNNKGNALDNQGEHEAAIKLYDEAIEIEPRNYAAWYNKCLAYNTLGKRDDAAKAIHEASKINPLNFKVSYYKGYLG